MKHSFAMFLDESDDFEEMDSSYRRGHNSDE